MLSFCYAFSICFSFFSFLFFRVFQLKSLLQPKFKECKGFCSECQKPTASLQSFMYHMGVKHRLVFAVSESGQDPFFNLAPEGRTLTRKGELCPLGV
jgi:hypothetical protein